MKHQGFLAAIVLLMAALCAAQQQTGAQSGETPVPTIKKETSLVLVDTVVTDKKGNYIRDLTVKDFRVWEDNKEQLIKTFSSETGASGQASQRHYLVLFFDNSTMQTSDQAKARDAAMKFLDANTGSERYIAIVDFGGTLKVTQNFTTDSVRLKEVVRNLKFSTVAANTETQSASLVPGPTSGIPQIVNAEANFAVHTMLLSLRDLAKGLSTVPGRKSLVLFSAGFPMDPKDPDTIERESELTAAINACNRANVAVYPIDVRGLISPIGFAPGLRNFPDAPPAQLVPAVLEAGDNDSAALLVYVQHGGGGAGGGGHGGGGAGGGHSGGTGTSGGGSRGGGSVGTPSAGVALPVAPYSQSRALVPAVSSDLTDNQQVLYELATGTGGFVIVNSDDLLGGMQRIANEQNQYYILGYTPSESNEGTCHTLKVKVDRGDTVVRSRSGYCNVRPADLLAGKPVEKQLETVASGSQPGNVAASMLAPYFYTSANTARVNLAIDIPSSAIKFEKQKGKQHAEINVLGLAYAPGGTVAARFSDNVEFDFDNKEQVEQFAKKPYEYENQFEIAPGKYQLKVAFSSGGQSLGKLEVPLTIDSYDAKQFSISAVAFSKELLPLNQAAPGLDAALLEDRTPLVAQGMQFVPSGTNVFKKTDMVVFYVELYDPLLSSATPPSKVGIQMLVFDRKTKEKKVDTGGPVPNAKAGAPMVALGLRIPLDKLPPGSYQLELRGVDSSGSTSPVRAADFEVE